MHQVKIESHYGQAITLEQCKGCGGVWFDESELYRAKQGEADRVNLLDRDSLRSAAHIASMDLQCPVDQTTLERFKDPYFPQHIIIEHCPSCSGFWLKRGEFVKYQKSREKPEVKENKSEEDIKFEKSIERLLAAHESSGAIDVLGRLGKFLSTRLDRNTLRPLESAGRSAAEERVLNVTLHVLTQILRAFVR